MNVVRSYEPGDIRPGFHRIGDETGPMHALLLTHGSFMRTLEIDGEIAAVLGLKVRWAGVAEVWAVVGEPARGHGVWLTRTCIRLLDQFAEELKLRRIGATVKQTQHENLRWIRRLGFVYEGQEYAAGPHGETLLRYVRWMKAPALQS